MLGAAAVLQALPQSLRWHQTPLRAARSGLTVMSGTDLPRTPKALVAQLRETVQGALQLRQSRMRASLPPGFDYGIESQRKGKQISSKIARSDRELARLFVEMFQGTGLVPTVCFCTVEDTSAASRLWGDIEARLVALDPAAAAGGTRAVKPANPTRAKSRAGGGGGFGAAPALSGGSTWKPASEVPDGAEVVFVVAPGQSQCDAVQKFCTEHGLDRLVVLLNARCLEEPPPEDADEASTQLARATGTGTAAPKARAYFDAEFKDVYAFLTDPAGKTQDPAVLFKRGVDQAWSLVSKPKVGPPRQLLQSADRPTIAAMRAAVQARQEEGLLDALGGVFGR